jgi:hypothetical protein
MKKYKTNAKENLYEVIVPLGPGSGDDGLFDDCPICQELKRQMGSGVVVPVQVEVEDDVN